MPTTKALPGTVVSGTHLVPDIIPELLDVLLNCDHPRYKELHDDWRQMSDENDDDALDELCWQTLFDACDECAPDGYYFGAHPGDGCDYGFWQVEEQGDEQT